MEKKDSNFYRSNALCSTIALSYCISFPALHPRDRTVLSPAADPRVFISALENM